MKVKIPMKQLTPQAITEFILTTFQDIKIIETWGETTFFYNPGNTKPRGTYFCTIKEKDGPNDQASNLDQKDILWMDAMDSNYKSDNKNI